MFIYAYHKCNMKFIRYMLLAFLLVICLVPIQAQQQNSLLKIGRVKYSGGGDWYNDQSSEVNLLAYIRKHTTIQVEPKYEYVDISSDNIFQYPILFMTGHGTVSFSDNEVARLKAYLEHGGFLYIDDDYGMDASIRKEMKKVFPSQNFIDLPFNHPLYSSHFVFPNGMPKIHEHDAKIPQGLGLFHNGKLCVFYTVETNPSDGWADPEIHHDTNEKREISLKIGTNIIVYALTR